MSEPHEIQDIAADNEESLQTLIRAIALSQGEFSPILVRCNYKSLRDRILIQLREQCPVKIRELVLDESVNTLYTTIAQALKNEQPHTLMVLGLESVAAIDQVIVATNQVREEFRKNFPFPLILWVNDEVLKKFIRLAPDFDSWTTTIEFAIATNELIDTLNRSADAAFRKMLDSGAGKFLDNAVLNIALCSGIGAELKSAIKDLENRGKELSPKFAAKLEFLLGRYAQYNCQMEKAREHYEKSMAFWQQIRDTERHGCLLFYLGLWWRRYAILNRSEYLQSCLQARDYFRRCIDVFQQGNRFDLAAKFINPLGEVLTRLEEWDELEVVAKTSVKLHESYPHASLHLFSGYACGMLAEVALNKSAWSEAKQYAELALQKNAQPQVVANGAKYAGTNWGWAWKQYQSWYLLLLAKAQGNLEQFDRAIANLENAKLESNPQYEPQLYIDILAELRSLYFQQGEYIKAFQIKQEKQSIEAQYGFRPFTGAASLRPIKRVINPAIDAADPQVRARERITASGRRKDLNRLIERLGRNDHKLIIIHGMSGVGKSSLLWAGLVPELKQNPIGDRNALPVTLRYYNNWVRELGNQLAVGLNEIGNFEALNNQNHSFDSSEAIIEQLQKNAERNLLTVLLFDQFEEFFFSCNNLRERRPFYEFMRVCLNLPYVKVVLSMREDYLHYLLECDRLAKLDAINSNILDKNIRYYLGDFSPERAKCVIRELTERSQFYLQPELIDELVKDLAGELGEIRPIELQVVGAQLQTDNITTLEQYLQLCPNPKEKLVQRSLEEVIKDCGLENERAARLVLYLLTNENGTRPLKTRAELEADLKVLGFASEVAQLDLVLEILADSGLVFLVPDSPANCYQLVHDYLVAFIRQQQASGLLAELAEAKEKQKLTEAQLRQALKEKEEALLQEYKERKRAEIAEIEALISLSQALWLSDDSLGALVASVKAGIQLKETEVPLSLQQKVVERLRKSIYEIRERNRLDGHSASVTSVCFSHDSKTIASASADKTVKLWSIDGTLVKTLKGHCDIVWDVNFSPDRKTIASASADTTIKIWSRSGTLLHTLQGHNDQVLSVSFSPETKTIISTSADKTIKIWSTNGTLLKTLHAHRDRVLSASFSPDGTAIASASADGIIQFWSRDTKVFSKDGILLKTIEAHGASANCVCFSPDSQIIASASSDGTIKLWSRRGKLLTTIKGHTSGVNSISFSPDGQTIASASTYGTIKLWNKRGKLLKTLQGHNISAANNVSFSFDGEWIASVSEDKTVRLWSRYGAKISSSELDDLLVCGCNWLRDYLKNNSHICEGDRTLCDNINPQK